MAKIRVAVAGYGNVGRGVLAALKNNPDMEAVGVLSRNPDRVKKSFNEVPVMQINDVDAWLEALKPDVAILCGGSKDDLPVQGPALAAKINTVDSFDNHSRIPEYFAVMDEAAKAAGHVSVISTVAARLVLSIVFGIWMNLGVIGIALAMCSDWAARAVCIYARYKSGKWKQHKVI